jgi:hypothetical protein
MTKAPRQDIKMAGTTPVVKNATYVFFFLLCVLRDLGVRHSGFRDASRKAAKGRKERDELTHPESSLEDDY